MSAQRRRTQRWRQLPAERPHAIHSFVSALRDIKDCTPLAQASIADQAGVSQTTFSGYLNGRRVPERHKLEALFKVIQDDVQQRGRHLPHDLSALFTLRERARAANGPHFASVSASGTGDQSLPTDPEPAAEDVALDFTDAATSAPRVPVPQQQGDRHPRTLPARGLSPDPSTVGQGFSMDEIRRHYASGRRWDAVVLISHAARRLPSGDFPAAVFALRGTGIERAVESLLKAAAASRDTNAVINIAAALHEHQQFEEVGVVLAAARTRQHEPS